ncbi:MAG: hemolysin family protein [Acidobacteriaceae bacterium]|jgi:CBS domain containing-hemolysin-like protein|nr:hemolysin family protein [Acidobacteriaceae bacterium]
MIPLAIFLLGCLAVYLGAIGSAFSSLMRLSLRLLAERSDRPGELDVYLDEPILLFTPVRLLLGFVNMLATALMARTVGLSSVPKFLLVLAVAGLFVAVFELLLPLLIIGRDPERVLEILLPSFSPIARVFAPLSHWTTRVGGRYSRNAPAPTPETQVASGATPTDSHDADATVATEGEERRLLQSIVDFGDTLVREIMTPRPDIVGIREDATIGDLRGLFREQEYSRFPVYRDSLDNIAGFVFVKDVVPLDSRNDERPLRTLLRPAVVVPESKRIPELLRQFQRQRIQIAVVVDEYGGTAGLVTIEDMLEELVGEIRDEYDLEAEPIVDEGNGSYVLNGNVDIDEVSQRLGVEIDREGFETVGGFLLAHLGRVPTVGERVDIDGVHVEVLDVNRRRINKVRITRSDITAEGERAW